MYKVIVRNNYVGISYSFLMELSDGEVSALTSLGVRLTAASDWDLSMTVLPVKP